MADWWLEREPTVGRVTPGRLTAPNGRWWYTLEDAVRERPGVAVAAWKVHGLSLIHI